MIFLEIDPNVVKPGWTPMIITILLAAAITLLMISMRRQMKKVRLPSRDDLGGAEELSTDQAAAAGDQAAGEPTSEDPADAAAEDEPQAVGNSGRATDS